jgi:hypothetical protein
VPSTALILPDHQQPGLTVAMNWIQGLKKR